MSFEDVLAENAARAYRVDPQEVRAMLSFGPIRFSPEWLKAQRFTGDPTTVEHQAYLAARLLAEGRASGDDAVKTMVRAGIYSTREAITRTYEASHRRVARWWARVRRKVLRHS